jgi:hypothetical protein
MHTQLSISKGGNASAEILGPRFTHHIYYKKSRRQVAVAAITDDVSLYVQGSPDGLLTCLLVEADHTRRRAARKSKPFRAFDGDHALQIVRGGVPLEVA